MSKKDGKATLLKSTGKKNMFILEIPNALVVHSQEIAAFCPVKMIKIL